MIPDELAEPHCLLMGDLAPGLIAYLQIAVAHQMVLLGIAAGVGGGDGVVGLAVGELRLLLGDIGGAHLAQQVQQSGEILLGLVVPLKIRIVGMDAHIDLLNHQMGKLLSDRHIRQQLGQAAAAEHGGKGQQQGNMEHTFFHRGSPHWNRNPD